jgi:hypothetical protein
VVFGKVIAGAAYGFSILEELSQYGSAAGITYFTTFVTAPNELFGRCRRTTGDFDNLDAPAQRIINELAIIATAWISYLDQPIL